VLVIEFMAPPTIQKVKDAVYFIYFTTVDNVKTWSKLVLFDLLQN
jgi:hypothetical protein